MDGRIGILVACVASACFSSHELPLVGVAEIVEDEPACDPAVIPEWLTGHFAIVGMGRTCLARDEFNFYADACGEGGWSTFDLDVGAGRSGELVRIDDDHWELRVDGRTELEIHRQGWLWHGREMLRIDAAGIGIFAELWAVGGTDVPPVEHDLDGMYCAVDESWSIHSTSVAPALAWGDGPVHITDGRDTGLKMRFAGDEVALFDGRLPTCGLDCARTSSGSLVAWDGATGVVRYRDTHGVCSALTGEAMVTREGDALILEQDWVVIDVTDFDGDGTFTDRVIRRTRTTLRACPP